MYLINNLLYIIFIIESYESKLTEDLTMEKNTTNKRQVFQDIFGNEFAGSVDKWGKKVNGNVIVQGHTYGVSVRFPTDFPNYKNDPGRLELKVSWGKRVLFFGGHKDGIANISVDHYDLKPRAKLTCQFYLYGDDGDCKKEFKKFEIDLAKYML